MGALWSESFLTDEHLAIAEVARNFANKEVRPRAREIDEKHQFPSDLIAKLSELGFMGMMVSPEWGGAGLDCLSYTVALEEIAVACASTAVIMSVNNSLVCHPIEKFGTEVQKERYLRDLATGKKLGCYCLSEPGTGSDAAAMKTRAVKKETNGLYRA